MGYYIMCVDNVKDGGRNSEPCNGELLERTDVGFRRMSAGPKPCAKKCNENRYLEDAQWQLLSHRRSVNSPHGKIICLSIEILIAKTILHWGWGADQTPRSISTDRTLEGAATSRHLLQTFTLMDRRLIHWIHYKKYMRIAQLAIPQGTTS